jgi:YD repeat-containing protein
MGIKELLEKIGCCKDGLKFVEDYKLSNYNIDKIDEIEGDYNGYMEWLKNYKNFKFEKNKFSYDYFNNPTEVVYDVDESTTYYKGVDGVSYIKYDDKGREILVGDEDYWIKKTYDEQGNMVKESNSNGVDSHYYYNNDNKITKTVIGKRTTKYTYDKNGNLIFKDSSNGNSKHWEKWVYDEKNRIKLHTSSYRGMETKYYYKTNGDCLKVNNNLTTMTTYDKDKVVNSILNLNLKVLTEFINDGEYFMITENEKVILKVPLKNIK